LTVSTAYLLQVFAANGLSKYYIHQIACYLPSRADVLPKDISVNHPGYACVLANVLEAATWILAEPMFASDRVGVLLPFKFLNQFLIYWISGNIAQGWKCTKIP
jgi:hypothetical protein